MWERGDKTNQGIPELNGSSVGMAKVWARLNLYSCMEVLCESCCDFPGSAGGDR